MFWILSTAFLIVLNYSINTETEVFLFQQFCFLKWPFPLRGSQFWSASLNCGYPYFDCVWTFHEADFKSIFIEGGRCWALCPSNCEVLGFNMVYLYLHISVFVHNGAFSISPCTDNSSVDKTMVDIVIKLSTIVSYMSSSHKTLKSGYKEEWFRGGLIWYFCFSWYNLRH